MSSCTVSTRQRRNSNTKMSKQASILTFLSPVRNTRGHSHQVQEQDQEQKTTKDYKDAPSLNSTVKTPDKVKNKPLVEVKVIKADSCQDEEDQERLLNGNGKRFSVKKLLEEEEENPVSDPVKPLPLPKLRSSPRCVSAKTSSSTFSLLEIVWAKFSLYPPWPAIVCFHKDEYLRGDKIHVQFFDSINSRAWVRLDGVQKANQDKPLTDESIKGNGKWRKELKEAVQQASKAEKKDPKGRQALIGASNEVAEDCESVTTSEEDGEDFKLDDTTEDDDEEYEEKKPKAKKRRRSSGSVKKKQPPTKKVRAAAAKRVKENRPPRLSDKLRDENAAASPNFDDLSEYELIRQRNIESRQRMFMELNISGSKQRLSDSFYGPETASAKQQASRRGLAARKSNGAAAKDADLPVRKSLRLQNMAADTSVALPEKEPAFYNVPVAEEHPRLPIKTLELADVVLEADHVEDKASFLSALHPHLEEKAENTVSFGDDIKSSMQKLAITVTGTNIQHSQKNNYKIMLSTGISSC